MNELVKPPRLINCFFGVSKRCNLRCSYCYLPLEQRTNKADENAIAIEGCERLLKKAENEGFRFNRFSLHGAETFTLEPETIVRLAEMVYAHAGRKVNVHSNGVLLTAEYLARLGNLQEKLVIGLSIDGPKNIHDRNRGKTYDIVWKNANHARRQGYKVNALVAVSSYAIQHLEEFEAWMRMMDSEKFWVGLKLVYGPNEPSEEEQEIFGQWLHRTGYKSRSHTCMSGLCVRGGNNCHYLEFDPEGFVYSCNKNFKPEGRFANWRDESLEQIIEKRRALYIKEFVSPVCATCAYNPICNSGCPLERNNGFAGDCKVRRVVFDQMIKDGESIHEFYLSTRKKPKPNPLKELR